MIIGFLVSVTTGAYPSTSDYKLYKSNDAGGWREFYKNW